MVDESARLWLRTRTYLRLLAPVYAVQPAALALSFKSSIRLSVVFPLKDTTCLDF